MGLELRVPGAAAPNWVHREPLGLMVQSARTKRLAPVSRMSKERLSSGLPAALPTEGLLRKCCLAPGARTGWLQGQAGRTGQRGTCFAGCVLLNQAVYAEDSVPGPRTSGPLAGDARNRGLRSWPWPSPGEAWGWLAGSQDQTQHLLKPDGVLSRVRPFPVSFGIFRGSTG